MAQPIDLTTLSMPNSHLDDEEKKEAPDPAPSSTSQLREDCSENKGLRQVLENAAAFHAGITTYPPNCSPPHGIRTTYRELLQRAKAKAQLVDSIHGLSSGSVVLYILMNIVTTLSGFGLLLWQGIYPQFQPHSSTTSISGRST